MERGKVGDWRARVSLMGLLKSRAKRERKKEFDRCQNKRKDEERVWGDVRVRESTMGQK